MTENRPTDEAELARLAQEIRGGLYTRGMHVGPGVARDTVLRAMDRYMRVNGYEFVRLTAAQVAQNIANLTHLLQQNEPAIPVGEAHRKHVSDVRDALKWAAAFSTAALLFTGQFFRSSGQLLALSEAIGLAVAEIAFMLSIVGAGLFLITVDLPTAEWLRLLVTRVHLDLQSYRSAMQAYADANASLAKEDDAAVSNALHRAQVYLDEVQGRGEFPVPAKALLRWEKLSTWTCLGGFAIGILAVLGDFIAKMPLTPR